MTLKTELPTILATCVVCQGNDIPGCPCGVPGHPIHSEYPGKCNLAPIVYQAELCGLMGASKALGVTVLQVCAARNLAHQLDPAADAKVFKAAASAAMTLDRRTYSDRLATAIGF